MARPGRVTTQSIHKHFAASHAPTVRQTAGASRGLPDYRETALTLNTTEAKVS